ncbi:MAG: GGDEF domain-containing protein [Spirochaetes bacterium]|nr:GGDEF domain-containing protein [Spirochaetota bacterium]
MTSDNVLWRIASGISAMPKIMTMALSLLLIAVLGYLDYITGPEIAFSLFYLFPILLAAWSPVRIRWVIGLSALSAVMWGFADVASGHIYANGIILYWNTLLRLIYFLIITTLVKKVRTLLEFERTRARTDPLTGLWNMREMNEAIAEEIARLRRYSRVFTVAFIDLDNFKIVNDRFGHGRGDDVLRDVARLLRVNTRVNDRTARVGGDEFVVLFPETGEQDARTVLKKLMKSIMRAVRGKRYPISLSIGAATFVTPPQTVDDVIRIADKLMYAVKRAGKNNIEWKVVR